MKNLSPREAWRVASITLFALLLLAFFQYQHTILYLTGKWNQLESGDYGHGYLVLLISGYLIFYNRQRLKVLVPCPEYRAIFAIIVSGALWMIAALVDIEMLQTVALLLLLFSVLWVVLGAPVMRVLMFPVLYISFALPVWFPLSPLLQEFTADVVFWIIRLLDVPALRIENMIVLPAGRLSIEEACSGLRYLLAALTLGAFLAYINYTTLSARLTVVLISAAAAVFANILRVVIVVYLGYTTDMQHALIYDHLMFGWYIFGGVMMVLLIVEARVYKVRSPASNDTSNAVVPKRSLCNKGKWQHIVIALLAALSLSLAPALVDWINDRPHSISSPIAKNLPINAGEWSVVDGVEDDWKPQYQGAIDRKMVFQDNNGHKIYLYLGLYLEQVQGKELIYYSNSISDTEVWRVSNQRAKPYETGGQQVLEQILVKSDGTKRMVWYWYRVAGQNTINKYHAKALQVLGILIGKRQASIVAIATKLDDEPEYTRAMLEQFTVEIKPSLNRVLADTK